MIVGIWGRRTLYSIYILKFLMVVFFDGLRENIGN